MMLRLDISGRIGHGVCFLHYFALLRLKSPAFDWPQICHGTESLPTCLSASLFELPGLLFHTIEWQFSVQIHNERIADSSPREEGDRLRGELHFPLAILRSR